MFYKSARDCIFFQWLGQVTIRLIVSDFRKIKITQIFAFFDSDWNRNSLDGSKQKIFICKVVLMDANSELQMNPSY